MKTTDENKPVEVFAGTFMEAGMVKSMLIDAGIDAFLKDALIGTIVPWHAAPGGAGAVKIFVASRQLDEARAIVEQYFNNLKEK